MTSDADQAGPAGGTRPPARRPALTREQLLTAALQIIDEDGVEALTMRRLGQALDRSPMAIYRHAADRDALLDGVVELVAAELVAAELVAPRGPDRSGDRHGDVSEEGEWEAVLRHTAHTFRRVALAHPHVVPLLLTRPLSGPLARHPLGALRQLEQLLELFVTAGFDPQGALHAARLFTGFLYGHVLHERQDRIDNPDETDDLLRLGLHRLPLTQFPRLRSLATALATYDGAAELDEGLSIVLAGLRSQLRT
jgi:AcrR family transcriptional regulator